MRTPPATGCGRCGISGLESESGVPFGSLLQLLRPALGHLGRIPAPQAAALGTALALSPGRAGDRFAVGAATLSLLSRVAEDQPLLLLVDDAHLLDLPSAQALIFAARRLTADPVGPAGCRPGRLPVRDDRRRPAASCPSRGLSLQDATPTAGPHRPQPSARPLRPGCTSSPEGTRWPWWSWPGRPGPGDAARRGADPGPGVPGPGVRPSGPPVCPDPPAWPCSWRRPPVATWASSPGPAPTSGSG